MGNKSAKNKKKDPTVLTEVNMIFSRLLFILPL
jgi:hypothetical protein